MRFLSKFDTIEDARVWSEKFVSWYNQQHLHSALKFVTPEQRHAGDPVAILKNQQTVYEAAKLKQPLRWSKTPEIGCGLTWQGKTKTPKARGK
jgi:hypothetical protein